MQDTTIPGNRPYLLSPREERAGTRTAAYTALAAGVLVLFLTGRHVEWRGTATLHLLLESSATLLAVLIGVLALVRYYSRRNPTLLLIGAGFLGTSVLDAYHVAIAALHLSSEGGTPPIVPWSWLASRLFLSLLLVWSWTVWRQEVKLGADAARLPGSRIYLEVGGLTLVTIALFDLVRLPPAIVPDALLPRPAELLPGLLFAVALAGYLRKGNWRSWPFEVWLVPALLVAVASQVLFMAFSRHPLDTLGVAAHALKIVSYGFVLVGLIASMYGIYRQLERSTCLIRHANTALHAEVEERVEAERAARGSEEKYRRILSTIQEGYFETDLVGNLMIANEAMSELLGYPPERLHGMSFREYTADASVQAVHDTFRRVYRTGTPAQLFGWTILREEGERRFVEASASAIRAPDGRITGFRGIVRDVTARREAEERLEERTRALARSNDELRQLANVASHDLQEPLRMVAGSTRLLARRYQGRLDEEAEQYIEYALQGVARMQTLIQSLLHYSRVETRGGELRPVSAAEPLEWAEANLKGAIEEAEASVTHAPLPVVRADPTQLAQLFENLLANAIKFRGTDPLRVHVSAEPRGEMWAFRVRDNGIGIAPEHAPRIFEIFQRLHTREEYEGTGIGLAICKRIVERHGGEIWVRSTPGRGASFHFTLPAPPDGAGEGDRDAGTDDLRRRGERPPAPRRRHRPERVAEVG